MLKNGFTIDLNGNFQLRRGDGTAVPVKGRLHCALLALVATSRDSKRSRDWLKVRLWPRTSEPQCSYSLRAALSALRRDLEPTGLALHADRTHVWLEGAVCAPRRAEAEFYEDAPHLGELFEDWLAVERAAPTPEPQPAAQEPSPVLSPRSALPLVAVNLPVVLPDCPVGAALALLLCDQIIGALRMTELVDVLDLRDLDTDQLSRLSPQGPPLPNARLQLHLVALGDQRRVSVTILGGQTPQVLRSVSVTLGREALGLGGAEQLLEFANQAVDTLHAMLLSPGSMLCSDGAPAAAHAAAVHQIVGMGTEGQRAARESLRTQLEAAPNAVTAAWYAFSLANCIGEATGGDADAIRAEAEAISARALELDPTNPLAMALVGHVYGFVLRRVELGRELLDTARHSAPHLSIAWDLAAMNALYGGALKDGHRFAQRAQRLGRFSPYKPLFDSSLVIASTVTGRHEEAVRLGTELLTRRPAFLAVMRHMTASLAATGRIDEARRCVASVQARDAAFQPGEIRAAGYPLPCAESVTAIEQAFETLRASTS